jgi:hypothetical protein
MADIRISALPNEPSPNGGDFVAIDLASTRKTTVTLLTEAGRPTASQAEAEAGTDPTKAMTPLTVAQAITAQGPAQFQVVNANLASLAGLTLVNGDILYATGAGTLVRLAAGTPNQVLQIIAGVPTWQNVAGTGDVVGPASSTDGRVVMFNGATGKLISDSGKLAADVVTGPASSISGSIPTYGDTSGKILAAANPTMADFLNASTGPMPSLTNNGADATNDIDFSVGSCFSTDSTHWPIIAAALTKRLDAAWAVGNNAGGRMSAAAIANTTYHCYVIRRPDTGVVDFGFDTSATSPTLPANYTQYRRIGAIIREGGVIVPFFQNGDLFRRRTPFTAISGTAAYGALLTAMGTPAGITTQPLMRAAVVTTAAQSASVVIGDAALGGLDSTILTVGAVGATEVNQASAFISSGFNTNTASQIYTSLVISAGSVTTFSITSMGWIDLRGK